LNCRNTTQIFNEIQNITGFSNQNYSKIATNGLPVNYYIWKNDDEQLEKIELLLERLLEKEHILPDKITILSSRTKEESIIVKSRKKILNYSQNSANCLSFLYYSVL
jgi:hypothetical protein